MQINNVKSIMVVCAGNICRSPMAEVILKDKIKKARLNITVSSSGVGNWHECENANPKTIQVLTENGYAINHRAQQFKKTWFDLYDLILVMDHKNMKDLLNIASEIHKNKIKYFLQFDKTTNNLEVPDPYYEKIDAFYKVFGILESASDIWVQYLRQSFKDDHNIISNTLSEFPQV